MPKSLELLIELINEDKVTIQEVLEACGYEVDVVYTDVYEKEIIEERHHPCTGEYQSELEIIERWKKDGFKSNGKQGLDFRFIKTSDTNTETLIGYDEKIIAFKEVR